MITVHEWTTYVHILGASLSPLLLLTLAVAVHAIPDTFGDE